MIEENMDEMRDTNIPSSLKLNRREEYCLHIHRINNKCVSKYSNSTFGRCYVCKEKKKNTKEYSVCLICGQQNCHGDGSNIDHSLQHFIINNSHNICLNLATFQIWCYECKKGFSPDSMLSIKSFLKKAAIFSKNSEFEKIVKSIPKPKMPVVGLQNIGYTCYMSSVLQCLYVLYDFRSFLFDLYTNNLALSIIPDSSTPHLKPISIEVKYPYGPMSYNLFNLFQELSTTTSKYIMPLNYCETMKETMVRFVEHAMHDSHEYLLALLDFISSEIYNKTVSTIKNVTSDLTEANIADYTKFIPMCFPDTLFSGEMSSELICLNCNDKVVITEPFLDLSLPINITDHQEYSKSKATTLKANKKVIDQNNQKFQNKISKQSKTATVHKMLHGNESLLPGGYNSKEFKNKNTSTKKKNYFHLFMPTLNSLNFLSKKEHLSEGAKLNSHSHSNSNSHKNDSNDNENELLTTASSITTAITSHDSRCIKCCNSGKGDPNIKPYVNLFTNSTKSECKNEDDEHVRKKSLTESSLDTFIYSTRTPSSITRTSSFNDILSMCGKHCIKSKENVDLRIYKSMSLSSIGKNKNHLVRSLSLYNLTHKIDHSLISLMQHCKLNSTFHSCVNPSIKDNAYLKSDKTFPEASIYHCLNRFFAAELLDKNNRVQCNNCSKLRNAKIYSNTMKMLKIIKLPKLLVIHFKRFKENGHNYTKLNDHIEFPMELNLLNYCDVNKNKETIYNLNGVIEHTGNLNHGHYIAYIKYSNKTPGEKALWFIANDHLIRVTTIETVLKANAYILFYNLASSLV